MSRYLLAALVACGLLMYGGWQKIQRQAVALNAATQRNDELAAATASRRNTIRLLAELDTQHTKEITDARAKNQALLDRIGAGSQRLSVVAKCPTVRAATTAAGVDDAEARAELDPAHARRIVAIPADGDDAIDQLTALQHYVDSICQRKQ